MLIRVKFVVTCLLVFLISLPTAGLAVEANNTQNGTDGSTVVTLLHTNDIHGRAIESSNDGMGLAKISTLAAAYRAENPNTLLLDIGDTFHGTTFATLVRGDSILQLMNAIGYDAFTPGNHDFNYGYDRLVELAELADFPVLSANVRKADGSYLLPPYVILETGGIKLGLFGLSTPETTYKTHPDNVRGLAFTDPAEEARAIIAELSGQVDAIIALAHLGIDEASTDTSLKLAREVAGIDVIVDGHSHSTLINGLEADNGTLIVSAGEYTKNLGVVQLKFDASKQLVSRQAQLITVEDAEAVEPDLAIMQAIEEIQQSQQTVLNETVGYAHVRLDGERELVRAGETNLGNLITNAMLDISGAEAAITNGGGIRASIEAGQITKGDVISVLPFGNYIVTKQVSGEDIKLALENGVDFYPESKGAFPHVAGIRYKIDPDRAAGERVYDLTIGGAVVEPERLYIVAINDFMAAGGDEYTMFIDAPTVYEFPALDEALITYIQKLEQINIQTEGRIQAAPAAPTPAPEVPAPTEPAPDAEISVYIVQRGDTLWAIGRQHGITWQTLAEWNSLNNPHLIFPGQHIQLQP